MVHIIMQKLTFKKAIKGDLSVLDEATNYNAAQACVCKTPDLENNIVHIAVQYGHLDLLKAAINRFPELLLQKNKNGDTPLHMAAQWGSKEMVKTLISLLKNSSTGNTDDDENDSSEHFLMEINKQGNTPFHVALRSNNMEAVEELFECIQNDHPQILLTRNIFGDVPLHLYVKYCAGGITVGSWEYKELRKAKHPKLCFDMVNANISAMFVYDNEGLNPIMRAAQDGRIFHILWFLNYPPIVDCRDAKGKSFLHHLRLRLGDLNACNKDYTLYMCEKILAEVEVSSLLFSQDNDGNTPIHLVITDSDFDLAELILQRFVSGKLSDKKRIVMRIKNNEGYTVTDLIRRKPVIPFKLKKLMELVLMGKQMDEELYTAARYADTKIFMKQRSENNGDVSEEDTKDEEYFLSQDVDGNNIIHIALQHNQPHEHIKNFVEKAIYKFPSLMYQSDSNGDTPLHIAARLPYDIGGRFLRVAFDYWRSSEFDRGSQKVPPWRVKNLKGHTPLHEAAFTSNYQVLPPMKLDGFGYYDDWEPMSAVNKNGETFLHLLARYGHKIDDKATGGIFELNYRFMGECKNAVYMHDVDGFTPILRAAHCGQIWLVMAIGNNYPKSLYIRDSRGRTVLHHLCTSVLDAVNELEGILQLWTERARYTSEAAVRQTFTKDHDDLTFTKDHDGNTPLHLAIIHRNFEVAQFFIRFCLKVKSSLRKEIVDIKNRDGKTIMNLVTCESDISLDLKKLIEQASLKSIMDKTLYVAATIGDTKVFDEALSYDFRSQTYDGSNIIHVALRHNNISFIQVADKKYPELIYSKNFKGDTPLHVAARLQTYDLEQFIRHFSSPLLTVRDLRGNSFLHEAARSANYQVIATLLSIMNDTYIQDVNNDGENILHLVARYAAFAAKDFLEKHSLKMRPLTNMRDFEGFTPILRAVQCGRLGVAKLLLKENPESAKIPDNKGRTVLHHLKALVVDLDDDLKDILPIWMDLFKYDEVDELRSVQNEDGNTPLHLAIIDAAFIKAKFLIEMCLKSTHNRSELDIVNNDGFTVFDLLASRAHIPATKELQQVASRSYVNERKSIIDMMDQKLYDAAVKGNADIFDESSELGDAYFYGQTPGGSNLIHVALGHESDQVVEFVRKALHRFSILSMKPDNNGDTPLHIAAKWKSSVKLVKLLIEASNTFLDAQNPRAKSFHVAPWAIKNCKGSYPIHEALQTGNLEAARFLLKCDKEAANRVNDLGENPLHAFAKNGVNVNKDEDHADNFVKALTEDIPEAKLAYMRDNEGLTPLLSASRSGRFQVVKAILKYCPQSAYLRDPCGRNFLHLLRFTGEDVDESLAGTFNKTGKQLFEIQEANAQRLVQDHEGNTPLHYAIKSGNSIAAIVLTHKCLEDKEQKELKLVDKQGQTVPDLLAKHDVPNEIIEQIRKQVPEAVYLARSSYGIRKGEMKESANALSVVAALLATITFAAAFQVPGGFDGDDGSPVLLTKPIFAVFVVANSTAMCCSMLCLFLLLWVMGIGKIHGSLMVLDISIVLLQSSFYLTLLAFTLGVFVVTVKKSFWLAILVCGLCFLTLTFITWRFAIELLAKCVEYGIPTPSKLKRSVKFFMADRKNASSSVPNTTNIGPSVPNETNASSSVPNMTNTGTFVHNTPHANSYVPNMAYTGQFPPYLSHASSYVPNTTYMGPFGSNVAHASSYMPNTAFTGPSTSNMTHASSYMPNTTYTVPFDPNTPPVSVPNMTYTGTFVPNMAQARSYVPTATCNTGQFAANMGHSSVPAHNMAHESMYVPTATCNTGQFAPNMGHSSVSAHNMAHESMYVPNMTGGGSLAPNMTNADVPNIEANASTSVDANVQGNSLSETMHFPSEVDIIETDVQESFSEIMPVLSAGDNRMESHLPGNSVSEIRYFPSGLAMIEANALEDQRFIEK